MQNDTYVVLTGAKNNSGDFLIKQRTKDLLLHLRPDRKLIELDSWRPLEDEQLGLVNASRALILAGGPALQPTMWPGIYPLRKSLSDISVPIIAMGIGWKSPVGDWESTHRYPLSPQTLELLSKVNRSGYLSSVRDYHSLNVLLTRGLDNFMMTGCPALFSIDHVGKSAEAPKEIRRVAFSVGVSFSKDAYMDKSQKSLILALKDRLSSDSLLIVFHHSVDDKFARAYDRKNELFFAQRKLAQWLDQEGLTYVDVSGDASRMIALYSSCDMHIGYRVHAHVLMSSISKPSILISEDGRGKAISTVIGGLSFDGYLGYSRSWTDKIRQKLGLRAKSFKPVSRLAEDVIQAIDYEQRQQHPRLRIARSNIDNQFIGMKSFIRQLP